jgi:hypothetical protein
MLAFYEDEDGHEPVLDWLRKLIPRKRRAIGVAMSCPETVCAKHRRSAVTNLERVDLDDRVWRRRD